MARTKINRIFQTIPLNIPNLVTPKTIEIRYLCFSNSSVGVFRVESFLAQFKSDIVHEVSRTEDSDIAVVVNKIIKELEEPAKDKSIIWTTYYKKFPLEFNITKINSYCWTQSLEELTIDIGHDEDGIQYSKHINRSTEWKAKSEGCIDNFKKFNEDLHDKYVSAIEKIRQNYCEEREQLTNKYKQLYDKEHNKIFNNSITEDQINLTPLDKVLKTYIL